MTSTEVQQALLAPILRQVQKHRTVLRKVAERRNMRIRPSYNNIVTSSTETMMASSGHKTHLSASIGFGIILSIFAVFVIHANISYPTCPGWLPDPFFRLFLKNVHKDKHGNDTGTYDHKGR